MYSVDLSTPFTVPPESCTAVFATDVSAVGDNRRVSASAARTSVGPWSLEEVLGRGGNARVWRATRPGMPTAVALKVINTTKVEREPYQRFVREIAFLREHQDREGVLPLLDAHL